MAEFEAYPWPGNVRELRNVVERAVYRAEDPERPIDEAQFDPFHSPWAMPNAPSATAPMSAPQPPESAEALPVAASAQSPGSVVDFRSAIAAYERSILEDALARNRFNQRATATALGLSYDQLRHALKRHKLMEAESA
jgi:psp operon transcriptional activator